jgi:hypothetical protein
MTGSGGILNGKLQRIQQVMSCEFVSQKVRSGESPTLALQGT